MTVRPPLLLAQTPVSMPVSVGVDSASHLIVPPPRVADLFAHFPSEVYSITAETNLVRFVKVLCGEAGVGHVRQRLVVARLQQVIQGTHFFDLDRFYGVLFGIHRRVSERLTLDPYVSTATPQEWDDNRSRDSSFRSRVEQFGRAIQFGATPTGMELMAEALLGADCDIYESFVGVDRGLEPAVDRWVFTVVPKRAITAEERHDLFRVLTRLKPVNTLMRIADTGLEVHQPVSLRAVYADSEHWEVRPRYQADPDEEPVEQSRPPFTGYQGESWCYNGAISGIVAYSERPYGTVTDLHDLIRIYQRPGEYIDYLPRDGFFAIAAILAGRSVSDGILVAHPYAGPRPSQFGSVTAVSPVFSDRIPLGMADPVTGMRTRMSFWPSVARSQDDETAEILEVSLIGEKLVNYIKLEASHYPMTVRAQVWNTTTGEWDTILKRSILDSRPQTLAPNLAARVHPHHAVAENWLPIQQVISPVLSDRFRFVLERGPGRAPRDRKGRRVDYSVALRNITLGYSIRSRGDLPKDRDLLTPSVDAFGTNTIYPVFEQKAAGLLDSPPKPWRSEPQPISNAVVNLYVDTRDADGETPTIDRFYIDPLNPGPHLSLYYTDDNPTSVFAGSEDPLPAGVVSTVGVVGVELDGLSFDPALTAYAEITNEALQFDPTRPWWVVLDLRTQWPSTIGTRRLLSFGATILSLIAEEIVFETEGGDTVSVPVGFAANSNLKILAGYLPGTNIDYPTDSLRLAVQVNEEGLQEAGGIILTPITTRPDHVRVAAAESAPGIGGFLLRGLSLKSGVGLRAVDLVTIMAAMPDYATNPMFLADRDGRTDNALLRFHVSQVSDDSPYGFEGGPGDFWAALAWHPVPRDFQVHQGYLYLPPTKAKFWKFEFTNLVAEPYQSFLPITRRVQIFPVGRVFASRVREGNRPYPAGLAYSVANAEVEARHFTDSVRALTLTESAEMDPSGHTLASALFIEDPIRRVEATQQSWLTAFAPWQQGTLAPRFVEYGSHWYENIRVRHSNKIAFFAGLKELRAYRLDYTVEDDTPVFYERFLDLAHMDPGFTFNLDPGVLHTVGMTNATAESITLRSAVPMRSIQFATQQSDPVQVIPNDEFRDPTLIDSTWDDVLSWHRIGGAILSYSSTDFTVTVHRNITSIRVDPVDEDPVVTPPVKPPSSSFPYEDEGVGDVQGLESSFSPVSSEGRVYAAVRFTAQTMLTSPLFLEIIGTDGRILASKPISARQGETIESYVGYTLNAYDPRYEEGFWPARTIVDLPFQPLDDPALSPSAGSSPPTDIDNQLAVRLVQYGPSVDSWTVDALSLFDDSIYWEFSNDDGTTWVPAYGVRNNANAAIIFPQTDNRLRWRVHAYRDNLFINSIQIRPLYDGRLTLRTAGPHRGPNLSTYDQENPIDEDPEFTSWTKPVPRSWFLVGRHFPKTPPIGQPPRTDQSRSFGRQTADVVGAITDAASRLGVFHRDVAEAIDTDDVLERGSSLFLRTMDEAITVTDESRSAVTEEEDPVVRPPLAPPAG